MGHVLSVWGTLANWRLAHMVWADVVLGVLWQLVHELATLVGPCHALGMRKRRVVEGDQ